MVGNEGEIISRLSSAVLVKTFPAEKSLEVDWWIGVDWGGVME